MSPCHTFTTANVLVHLRSPHRDRTLRCRRRFRDFPFLRSFFFARSLFSILRLRPDKIGKIVGKNRRFSVVQLIHLSHIKKVTFASGVSPRLVYGAESQCPCPNRCLLTSMTSVSLGWVRHRTQKSLQPCTFCPRSSMPGRRLQSLGVNHRCPRSTAGFQHRHACSSDPLSPSLSWAGGEITCKIQDGTRKKYIDAGWSCLLPPGGSYASGQHKKTIRIYESTE